VTNESILISEVIPATPQRIFSAWMDSAEHSAFTGDKAMVVARVGGEHRAANGYIQGRTLELNEGSRIVQSWRTTEFPPESPDSRVEITLEPTLGGTLVTLLHTDIPVGQGDRYRQSWNEYYLSRLKAYFSDGAADADGENTQPTAAALMDADEAGAEIDLDEETGVGDLEPTTVADAPTKVMRANVKRALAASSRSVVAIEMTEDNETLPLEPAGGGEPAARPAPARKPAKKPAKKAAIKASAKAAKPAAAKPRAAKRAKVVAKAAAKARRPAAKTGKRPGAKAAARRPSKPVKKVAAKVSRKPGKKPAGAAKAKRPAGKRKGAAKR